MDTDDAVCDEEETHKLQQNIETKTTESISYHTLDGGMQLCIELRLITVVYSPVIIVIDNVQRPLNIFTSVLKFLIISL